MTRPTAPENRPDVDAALSRLFAAPGPNPTFVDRLERELAARAAEQAPARRSWLAASPRQRWAAGALALALVLALALAVAGPQRVLAQFQRLLGYVPGVGFVDLDATRVLTAPVQVTRDGVTLRITQVLAQPDETLVLYEAEGVPPYDFDQTRGPGPDAQAVGAALQLPDGTLLAGQPQASSRGSDTVSGSLGFSALPEGVYQASLLLTRLPYVEPGAAPEDWAVPLTLRLATGELVAEVFPQPYVPVGAEDTQHGITLRVLVVAHSPEATVLKLQAEWADPTWRFGFFTRAHDLRLLDDLGHSYGPPPAPSQNIVVQRAIEMPPPPDGAVTPEPGLFHYELDQAFASLSPSATRLTLPVPAVTFDVPVPLEFEVDLGPQPRVGDYIPLEIPIDAAGVPLRITGARLAQEKPAMGPTETWLRFDIAAPPAADGRSVHGLHFLVGTSTPAFDGGATGYQFAPPRLDAALRFKTDQPLPTGPVRIQLAAASLVVPGPWELAWDIPSRTAPPSEPVTLMPSEASQARGGLTLRVERITLTDRVTVVTLDLASAGTRLHQPSCWVPGTAEAGCWLEDNLGQRYTDPGVGWQTVTPPLTDTLVFDAARPLAQRLTLHVPAVEVAMDGAAAFEVDVPPEALARPLNQPWRVDIPLLVAGQALRFSEARLIEANGLTQLVLKSDPLDTSGERFLTGLQLAAVTGPDGQPLDLADTYSRAGPDALEPGRNVVAMVFFPVGASGGLPVQPGRYHVALSGATLGVRGPWALTWELPGP